MLHSKVAMMNNDSKCKNTTPEVVENTTPDHPAPRGRRRFLGASIAASTTITTIASQPALGTTCFTPSRSLSRNTSVSQQGKFGACNGQPPSNYKTATDNWPGYPLPTTPFHDVFAKGAYGTFLNSSGLSK